MGRYNQKYNNRDKIKDGGSDLQEVAVSSCGNIDRAIDLLNTRRRRYHSQGKAGKKRRRRDITDA
jgi:hypothetical protein